MKRQFGNVRCLPSGRWQARYVAPGTLATYKAPRTFDDKREAQAWLRSVQRDIRDGVWTPPTEPKSEPELEPVTTFGIYAASYIELKRAEGRSPRTLELYQSYLNRYLLPRFGDLDIQSISPDVVKDWYVTTNFVGKARRSDATGGTSKAHAYGLLSQILRQAERDDVIVKSPCRIVGAATPKRLNPPDNLLADQPLSRQKAAFEIVRDTLPEQWRIAATLGLFGSLRWGEVTALRRGDVDLEQGIVHVRRGVSRTKGNVHELATKTRAGMRKVHLPPSAVRLLEAHLEAHVGSKRSSLLVHSVNDPIKHVAFATFTRHWDKGRTAADQQGLTFHHLRHAGISLFARAGATERENQIRSGHASGGKVNFHYQHSDAERLREVADRMDVMWFGKPKVEAARVDEVLEVLSGVALTAEQIASVRAALATFAS
ncbi:MAG: site-specific integrase [Nocardiaceae bacterium]|nr:site-specific integrase [Nocardiaceae bacterium]